MVRTVSGDIDMLTLIVRCMDLNSTIFEMVSLNWQIEDGKPETKRLVGS